MDLDGKSAVSNIIALSPAQYSDIYAFPNPSGSETTLMIASTTKEKAYLKVYNEIGQVIMEGEYGLHSGKNSIALKVETWAKGVYYLGVTTSEISHKIKFVKH